MKQPIYDGTNEDECEYFDNVINDENTSFDIDGSKYISSSSEKLFQVILDIFLRLIELYLFTILMKMRLWTSSMLMLFVISLTL